MHGEHGSAPIPPAVQMQRGRFFNFALPAGWQVQENTNLLCLNAPNGSGAIMHVGLIGMMQPFTPDQFILYALNMHQMMEVRFTSGRAVQPVPGCAQAGVFEVTYVINGIPCQGVVFANVALGYQQCNAYMTLAAGRIPIWPALQGWLPQVATQVSPAGPQTYMNAELFHQSQRNTAMLAQHFHEVNTYINELQHRTTNDRWASDERNQFYVRENLGSGVSYVNPYESRTVEMPRTHSYYWVNRDGRVVGSDDPSYDPRQDPRFKDSQEWQEMRREQPRGG